MSSSESENREAATSTSNIVLDDRIEDGKNKSSISCVRCKSLILRPRTADFQKKEFSLPKVKSDKKPVEEEKLNDFWLVSDMFTFENLGFTNTLNDIKYLICADCEVGPIGLHNVTQKNRFYIALDRVHHGN